MKKNYALLALLLICVLFGNAKIVDKDRAMQVARNFYLQNTATQGAVTLNLIYECKSTNTGNGNDGTPFYYAFNVGNGQGFVIVAAEDLVRPILGYNTTGRYTIENMPPALSKWMEGYRKQIVYVRQNSDQTTSEIAKQWHDYYYNIAPQNTSRATQSVNPLCQTTWDQAPYYNAATPYDQASGQHCVTGCVATAMAQIIKYWNYPAQGTGFHSYNEQHYGTLTANFASSTYNWGNMPNSISSNNADIAGLMSDCGISVDMNYSPNESGAWVAANYPQTNAASAENSYKTYFGYDPGIQGVPRENYSDNTWVTMIKTELDASRPIQYAGSGGGGGHTWVCDGYDQNSNFHMNWGWSGNSDGYFPIDNLDPAALGAGGGTGGFNSGQHMLIGIKPLNNGGGGGGGGTINQANIRLNSAITVTANPFVTGGSFSVQVQVANAGNTNFTGDFAAALFDSNGGFVEFIQEFTNQTINAQTYVTGTFTDANLSVIPGLYYIGIYYKNGSNNYSLMDPGSYSNPVTVTITGPYSDIQMYSNTTITPASPQVNQSFTVQANISNVGSSGFTGYVSCDLYDLTGAFVATIQEGSNISMSAGMFYPFTFTTAGLNVAPGTYYIGYTTSLDHQNYSLIYDQNFPNPVTVTIQAVPIQPDQYESDNTENTAHSFAVNFSGNSANVNTNGSNIHTGADYDYYTISLPSGTNYSIDARVHDKYSSTNGNSYTDDVAFSYNVNGGGWSDSYDDVLDAPVYVAGGGTVVFFVADYFQGTVGTYLLDMNITRGQNVGINEVGENSIKVFPNPTHDQLFIDAGDVQGNYTLKLFNTIGEVVSITNGNSTTGQLIKQDVSTLASGVYVIQLTTEAGTANSKFTVK